MPPKLEATPAWGSTTKASTGARRGLRERSAPTHQASGSMHLRPKHHHADPGSMDRQICSRDQAGRMARLNESIVVAHE